MGKETKQNKKRKIVMLHSMGSVCKAALLLKTCRSKKWTFVNL